MIHVQNLSKSYGKFEAVKGISFDIPKGQVVGFLGPNGAGKTTTMRMLTGFLGPTGGRIEIDGVALHQDLEAAKAKIGYLPENNPLYEDMTVVEYLEFTGEMRGRSGDELKKRIGEMLKLYGLRDVAGKEVGELSKGYRQRVGLACAAIDDPPILILDEPTSGLDPNQIIEIRNLIKEIGKTKTIILSTHNLAEVEATCDRIMIINKGNIVADNPVGELELESPQASVALRIKGQGDLTASLKEIPGVSNARQMEKQGDWSTYHLSVRLEKGGPEIGERIFDAAVEKGWKISEMHTEGASLEEVFAQLTKTSKAAGGDQ